MVRRPSSSPISKRRRRRGQSAPFCPLAKRGRAWRAGATGHRPCTGAEVAIAARRTVKRRAGARGRPLGDHPPQPDPLSRRCQTTYTNIHGKAAETKNRRVAHLINIATLSFSTGWQPRGPGRRSRLRGRRFSAGRRLSWGALSAHRPADDFSSPRARSRNPEADGPPSRPPFSGAAAPYAEARPPSSDQPSHLRLRGRLSDGRVPERAADAQHLLRGGLCSFARPPGCPLCVQPARRETSRVVSEAPRQSWDRTPEPGCSVVSAFFLPCLLPLSSPLILFLPSSGEAARIHPAARRSFQVGGGGGGGEQRSSLRSLVGPRSAPIVSWLDIRTDTIMILET